MFKTITFTLTGFAVLYACGSDQKAAEQAQKKESTAEDTLCTDSIVKRVRSKKNFIVEGKNRHLAHEEMYDSTGRPIMIAKYAYWGAQLDHIEKEYISYSKNKTVKESYTCKGKDSTLTMRQTEFFENGKKIKWAIDEQLHTTKPLHSFSTYQYTVTGTDSTVKETFELYNGDKIMHTYLFRHKKIVSHTISKQDIVFDKTSYVYDNNGLLTMKKNETNSMSTTETFDYVKGILSASQVKNIYNQENRYSITDYIYDRKGNITRTEYNNYTNSRKDQLVHSVVTTKFTYKNCLLQEERNKFEEGAGSGTENATQYEYTFFD